MIIKDMSIVSIVVKALEIGGILKVFLEFHDYTVSVSIVVDKKSGSISEIDIGTYKD
jgi:hypothetical protein